MARHRSGSQTGFTIIEVVMVLAIAGIILMMVLQAIPMLQRNSHNNRRKNDASVILEAVSHWELNNSGNVPTPSDNFLQYSTDKLSFYDPANIQIIHGDAHNAVFHNSGITDTDSIEVHNYAKCDPATPGSYTNADAGYNDVVALYAIETSDGSSAKCQEI